MPPLAVPLSPRGSWPSAISTGASRWSSEPPQRPRRRRLPPLLRRALSLIPPHRALLENAGAHLQEHYDGAQYPDATFDDDSYYTGGAYYYVQPADDDQE
ncbi:hypothetical protein ACQJBY_049550 [Aegilops geniculata]